MTQRKSNENLIPLPSEARQDAVRRMLGFFEQHLKN
jgi:hypothetical protein